MLRLVLVSLAVTAGCAAADPAAVRRSLERGRLEIVEEPAPPLAARVSWWLPNRLLDIADLAGVELHLGPGAGGRVVVTRALAYGYTASERALAVGFHGREAGAYASTVAGESVLGWRHKADLGLTRAPLAGSVAPVALGGRTGVDPDPVRDGWLDLEVAGNIVVLGWLVKVRAGELGDLVAGLAGLDPSGDDHPRPLRVPLEGAKLDLPRASPELARLLAALPGAATATARPLYADASGGGIVRLGLALEAPGGRRLRALEVVRVDGKLALLDDGTRLRRPWLR